ncbi:uncharacterized protein BJ171DRAFT_597363 [Polychytrium aggregatum]|uniref:uncharacterized protein n=1 Tax=Polychytrium aggregatum TaxID=110093 RepID=UPI0022FE55AF|nr:uncharacterized protein BJ171DRAFT_597363 [Polychytrium aggregatum]KAI9206712.1 hypothetical protein BJ171DRAFT_597363 [Polychytrium aggregatum]
MEVVTSDLAAQLRNVPLLSKASNNDAFIKELSESLHARPYNPGDIVISEGEMAKAMFFILRGTVQVISKDAEITFAELYAGSFFGEIGIVFGVNRTATVIAKTKLLLASLTSEHLAAILGKYPDVNKIIRAEAQERFQQLAKEMERAGKMLQAATFEKFHELRKDTSHGFLKLDSHSRQASRRNSELLADTMGGDFILPALRNSRETIARASNSDLSSQPPDDSTRTESGSGSNANSPAHSHFPDSGEESRGLNPHISSLQRQGVKRRASVAVWSDERLMQFAQNVTAGRDKMQSVLAQSAVAAGSNIYASKSTIDSDHEDFGRFERATMVIILKNLGIHDLCRYRRVSKGMMQLIMDPDNGLGEAVDLSHWHKRINDDVLTRVVSLFGSQIIDLNLKNCWTVTDRGLQVVAQSLPSLRTLNLASVWELTDAGIVQLVSACPLLEALDLSNCRKLTDTAVVAVMAACPNMSSLCLSYCKNLGNAILSGERWQNIIKLNIQRCTGITDAGFNPWPPGPFGMRELILSDCSFLSDVAVQSIARACPDLRTLSLSFCCSITEAFAPALSEGCPNLEVLDLSFCGAAVTDQSLFVLANGLRSLSKMSLRGCIQVSESGMDQLLDTAESLKVINLSQCKNISEGWKATKMFRIVFLTTQSLLESTVEPSAVLTPATLGLPVPRDGGHRSRSFTT